MKEEEEGEVDENIEKKSFMQSSRRTLCMSSSSRVILFAKKLNFLKLLILICPASSYMQSKCNKQILLFWP